MALEVFGRIRSAEAQAEEILKGAQREARDMLKSVEAACLADERGALKEQRALSQRILEEAAANVEETIQAQKTEDLKAREAVISEASQRLDTVAHWIFERVVNHGDR